MEEKILKFHHNTVATVRKLYNFENQSDIDQVVNSLRDWLKKQPHLSKKEYSREYLERSIILNKGSVERAKSQIDTLCSLRTLLPQFFKNYDARNGYEGLNGIIPSALLPQLTEDHYRINILKIIGRGLTKKLYFDAMTFLILFCEYIRLHDYCNGVVAILDYRDADIVEYMSSINFSDLHSLFTILLNGYAMRLKGIHVITSSNTLKSAFDIVKKMLSTKIASRVHMHDDIETLYGYVPKTILPSELGGDERSVVTLYDEWKDVLGTKENMEYFKEMSQAISDNTSKMKEKLVGTDLGLAGTFRSLTVD